MDDEEGLAVFLAMTCSGVAHSGIECDQFLYSLIAQQFSLCNPKFT